MKMWSGRFRQPLNPEFESWQRSFPFDKQLLKQELAASAAYGKLKASDTTRAAAIRNTVRSAYSGSRHGSRLIDNGSPSW